MMNIENLNNPTVALLALFVILTCIYLIWKASALTTMMKERYKYQDINFAEKTLFLILSIQTNTTTDGLISAIENLKPLIQLQNIEKPFLGFLSGQIEYYDSDTTENMHKRLKEIKKIYLSIR